MRSDKKSIGSTVAIAALSGAIMLGAVGMYRLTSESNAPEAGKTLPSAEITNNTALTDTEEELPQAEVQ